MFSDTVMAAMEAGDKLRVLLRQVAEIELQFGWHARFWAKVDVRGPDDCWPWTRHKTGFGHGTFSKRKAPGVPGALFAHRVAYELVIGPIPAGMAVCHSCDNPSCCNPAHLWLGTKGDNNRDCYNKGRRYQPGPVPYELRARGERVANARLTPEKVRMIVSSDLPHKALARQLGVSDTAVRNVRNGVTWGHVTGIKPDGKPSDTILTTY